MFGDDPVSELAVSRNLQPNPGRRWRGSGSGKSNHWLNSPQANAPVQAFLMPEGPPLITGPRIFVRSQVLVPTVQGAKGLLFAAYPLSQRSLLESILPEREAPDQ